VINSPETTTPTTPGDPEELRPRDLVAPELEAREQEPAVEDDRREHVQGARRAELGRQRVVDGERAHREAEPPDDTETEIPLTTEA